MSFSSKSSDLKEEQPMSGGQEATTSSPKNDAAAKSPSMNNEEDDDCGACNDNDYNYYDDEEEGGDDDYGCDLDDDGGCGMANDDDDDDDPYVKDPEFFDYELFPLNKIDLIVEKKCERLRSHLKLDGKFDAIYLLKQFKWNCQKIIDLYEKDKQDFLQIYFSDNNNNSSKSAESTASYTKLNFYLGIFDSSLSCPSSAMQCIKSPVTTTTENSAVVTAKTSQTAVKAAIKSSSTTGNDVAVTAKKKPTSPISYCEVCCTTKPNVEQDIACLPECLHHFCRDCWRQHFEFLIVNNTTSFFECMETECNSIASKEFVLSVLAYTSQSPRPASKIDFVERYRRLVSIDLVRESEDLQICPGEKTVYTPAAVTSSKSSKQASACVASVAKEPPPARTTTSKCNHIVWAKSKPAAKRVNCTSCETQFCFLCSLPYHAPNSCEMILKWNMKCQDDSETRNYLLVHTQDCPKCKVCIEKNGGCSHMTCNRCKHEFCWVCMNDWKTHGATYDCNRYKGNPEQDNAREALNRYTHYYHRWINHSNSLKFEKALKEQCEQKIHEKIMNKVGGGTLVDWEFLSEAADTLTRARYTLQYTYPYAYYSEGNNESKMLFENIQAELEREVENLSHSLEKVNLNDKFSIKMQMAIVEKRRKTLLNDFIQ